MVIARWHCGLSLLKAHMEPRCKCITAKTLLLRCCSQGHSRDGDTETCITPAFPSTIKVEMSLTSRRLTGTRHRHYEMQNGHMVRLIPFLRHTRIQAQKSARTALCRLSATYDVSSALLSLLLIYLTTLVNTRTFKKWIFQVHVCSVA